MKRIMIVEDSPDTLCVLKELLLKFKFNVVATSMDGESALTDFDNVRPDLLLLDLALPKMDGFKVMTEIFKKHPRAKIIVLSALYQSEYRSKAISAGCLDYILKPFEVFELLTPINKAFST